MNNYLINPAITGAEEYADLRLGYRNQWSGIDGAPETYYLSVHTPIKARFLKNRATQGPGLDYFEKPATQRPAKTSHHGIGGMVLSDNIGPFKQTQVNLSYAFHLSLSKEIALSAGVMGGFSQHAIDFDNVIFENELEPLLGSGIERDNGVDVAMGVWLYSKKFYIGTSTIKKFSKGFRVNNDQFSSDESLYFLVTGGYKIQTNGDIDLLPSFLIKYSDDIPLSLDVGMTASYKDRAWAGITYRSDQTVVAIARFAISHLLDIGYAYDFASSDLNTYSNGSHEIVLGFRIKNKNQIHSSRYYQ